MPPACQPDAIHAINPRMARPTLTARLPVARPFVAQSLVGVIGAVGAFLVAEQDWRQGALWLIAAALGGTLWQSSFSFAGAYRRALTERRTAGVRSQLLMIAITVCLFLPALHASQVFGQPVRGFVFPIGLALLVGAFLFGIGMQLGGGCGSGTLYAAGGGATRSWLTLIAFIAGATLAAWDGEQWLAWPAMAPVSLPDWLGFWPNLIGNLALLAAVYTAARRVEQARHGNAQPVSARPEVGFGGLTAPWPLVAGAIMLAGLNFLTLVVAGRPWAITAAFPLWGSKIIDVAGLDDPAFWAFWDDPTRTEALLRPLLADRTTIMDLGLIAGASLAAMLAGRTRPVWPPPRRRPALAALVGGMLLGYGAVLATGCNISAFFGGIGSGSLHGWIWIVPALAGNIVGIRLRPWFRLAA